MAQKPIKPVEVQAYKPQKPAIVNTPIKPTEVRTTQPVKPVTPQYSKPNTTTVNKPVAVQAAEAVRAQYVGDGTSTTPTLSNPNTAPVKPVAVTGGGTGVGGNQAPPTTPPSSDISSKIDEYIALMMKNATEVADANMQAQQNLIQQQLQSELAQAGIDTEKLERDYNDQVDSINQNTYSEMKDQQVESTSRGLLQTNQQIGFEQGINARANQTKYKAYQDRDTRLSEIQSRIATLRNKANVDIQNAQLQRNAAISSAQMSADQANINRLQNLEKSEVDFGYQTQLNQQQLAGQKEIQAGNQQFEREQTEVKWQQRISEMKLNEAMQVRLGKLEQQQKKEILAMTQANQVKLLQMDTAAKKQLMAAEFEQRKEFMKLDEAAQGRLMDRKEAMSTKEWERQIQYEALKSNPATADMLLGTHTSKVNQVSQYYEGLWSDLRSGLLSGNTYKFATLVSGGNAKIQSNWLLTSKYNDAGLNIEVKKLTGKSIEELLVMPKEKVQTILQNYTNQDFENAARKSYNEIFKNNK